MFDLLKNVLKFIAPKGVIILKLKSANSMGFLIVLARLDNEYFSRPIIFKIYQMNMILTIECKILTRTVNIVRMSPA